VRRAGKKAVYTEAIMSGRVYLLGLGLALVAGAFVLTDALLWRPGVTEASVRRVQPGMTLKEVEAMLGGPGSLKPRSSRWIWRRKWIRETSFEWAGPAGVVEVTFLRDQWFEGDVRLGSLVDEVTFARRTGANPLGRLRAWLGW
jgi:hypothetical protein